MVLKIEGEHYFKYLIKDEHRLLFGKSFFVDVLLEGLSVGFGENGVTVKCGEHFLVFEEVVGEGVVVDLLQGVKVELQGLLQAQGLNGVLFD